MFSLLKRSNSAPCLVIVLLALGMGGACNKKTPGARQDLVSSLKGANVDAFDFATRDDDTQEVSSLTNSAMRSPIKLANGNLVLKYTRVTDKKANNTRIYKTEIVRKDKALTVLVTDFASAAVVFTKDFPTVDVTTGPDDCTKTFPKSFNNEAECRKDFFNDCTRGNFAQCEATRTCQPIRAEIECCFKDGHAIAELLIIWPQRLCLTEYFPDQDLVFSQ